MRPSAPSVMPPTWLENLPLRPLCDIPWLGRAVVLSSGDVNFCCSSDAVVGNVNKEPLEEIWRGATMQGIRRSLAAQVLPPQCRTSSCPIHRGDVATYLHQRMDGLVPDHALQRRESLRRELVATRWECGATVRAGERVAVRVGLPALTQGQEVDVFLAFSAPDGALCFAPDGTDYPLPALRKEYAGGSERCLELPAFEWPRGLATGSWTVCVALFVFDSSPAAIANCLWSARAELQVVGGAEMA